MSDLGYLIWIVATALMIITVLTLGTLASAGMLGRDPRSDRRTQDPTDTPTHAVTWTEPDSPAREAAPRRDEPERQHAA
ncbi:hypothetical protein [Nocardioides soli]|uniref:Uncharacterized protein n=1 Tax=Nocardioides soli TaxID=1036020 RepID=A0A7W4VXF0_9ACTN|nr:hypothetical protein [Nocardioides soli]MBB3043455.1 hypothetical protein [Nocardioides soli]